MLFFSAFQEEEEISRRVGFWQTKRQLFSESGCF
jgi:hypothetical protein